MPKIVGDNCLECAANFNGVGGIDYYESANLPHGVLPTTKGCNRSDASSSSKTRRTISTIKKRCCRYVGISFAGALGNLQQRTLKSISSNFMKNLGEQKKRNV